MIYRLWLTLSRFFNYKPEVTIDYLSSASGNSQEPRIMVIHRGYRIRGGEDTFLMNILVPQLMSLGVSFEVVGFPALFSNKKFWVIDLLETLGMILGLEKLRPSYLEIWRRLAKSKPSHVIFNNFLPTISLEAPALCKANKATVIYWVHNSRLTCANGLLFNGKSACDKCVTRGSRWAFLQRCNGTWKQSLMYALIYKAKRVPKQVAASVDRYVCVSEYLAGQLRAMLQKAEVNIPGAVTVIRSPSMTVAEPMKKLLPSTKEFADQVKQLPQPFFTFLGRLSFEKGADRFLAMARQMPQKGFVMCGSGPMLETLKAQAPRNLLLTSYVDQEEKNWLFQNTAALVVPSRVPETFSLIISESDPFGTPIVYPEGGGAEEAFKWLGRSGCPLNEFRGQSFKRTEPNGNAAPENFKSGLAGLFQLSAGH